MRTCDYLIIGGGVVGLSVARELKLRRPAAKIVLIEKESSLGEHASGRNSGVIHSGIYYTADSLKARLTKEGNEALVAYCEEKEIPVRRCGKLIVARSEAEHPMLDELLRRGAANGVEVRDVSEEEARRIEPRAKTVGRALFVPSTASVDPRLVVAALAEDCRERGVEILTGTKYLGTFPVATTEAPSPAELRSSASPAGRGGSEAGNSLPLPAGELVAPKPRAKAEGRGEGDPVAVRTSAGTISAEFVVNCAGLYADKIARDFGFSRRYRILPFKGLYLESPEPPESLRCHIYPVPSKSNPFLGVHATVKPDGHWKIGPTAIPALWRENYGGLDRFDAGELAEIAFRQLALLFGSDFDFRRLAWEELKKQSKKRIIALASELVAGIDRSELPHPAPPRRPLPRGEAAPQPEPPPLRAGELVAPKPRAKAEGRGEGATVAAPPGWRWGTPGIRAQLIALRAPHPHPSPGGEGKTSLVDDFVLEGDGRSLHVLNAVSPAFTCCFSFARLVADRLSR